MNHFRSMRLVDTILFKTWSLPSVASSIPNTFSPFSRLMWPELQDDHLENSRKVPVDRHNIIIDKVAASHDNSHIVAVTSNNMVCIWRRTSEDDQGSSSSSSGVNNQNNAVKKESDNKAS